MNILTLIFSKNILGIGITSAVFHAFGKTLSSNELLINLVIMVKVAGRLSFKILADIL